MQAIIEKTYTKQELDDNHGGGDTLSINNELMNEFNQNNPDANVTKASGSSQKHEDESLTYTLTIEYDI